MSIDTRPAESEPLALSRGRTNLVFATIVLGMLLAALDQTIVSTALPTIVADLGGAGKNTMTRLRTLPGSSMQSRPTCWPFKKSAPSRCSPT